MQVKKSCSKTWRILAAHWLQVNHLTQKNKEKITLWDKKKLCQDYDHRNSTSTAAICQNVKKQPNGSSYWNKSNVTESLQPSLILEKEMHEFLPKICMNYKLPLNILFCKRGWLTRFDLNIFQRTIHQNRNLQKLPGVSSWWTISTSLFCPAA